VRDLVAGGWRFCVDAEERSSFEEPRIGQVAEEPQRYSPHDQASTVCFHH
jgi:hypothetical protein